MKKKILDTLNLLNKIIYFIYNKIFHVGSNILKNNIIKLQNYRIFLPFSKVLMYIYIQYSEYKYIYIIHVVFIIYTTIIVVFINNYYIRK